MNSNEFNKAILEALATDDKEALVDALGERTKTLVEELMKPTTLAEEPCVIASLIVAKRMYSKFVSEEDIKLAYNIADMLGSDCTVAAMPTELYNKLSGNDSP